MTFFDLQILIFIVLWFLIYFTIVIVNYNELTKKQKRDKELE